MKIEGDKVLEVDNFKIGRKGTSDGTLVPHDVMNFLYTTFEASDLQDLRRKMSGKWWVVKPNTDSMIKTLLRGYLIIPLGDVEEEPSRG